MLKKLLPHWPSLRVTKSRSNPILHNRLPRHQRRWLLAMTIWIVCGFLSFSGLAANDLPTPHKTLQQLDTIIATVNNEVITQNEFDKALALTKQQFKQQNLPLPNKKTLRKKVLQNLIDQQLQLQLAKQHGIKTSNKEVQERIRLIAKKNKVSVTTLKAQVQTQGLRYADFKKHIRNQITMGKVQREMVQGSMAITKQDIADFRKQHANDIKSALFHVGDILIPIANVKDDAQKSKAHSEALALMRSIRKGTSVYDAVKKFNVTYNDLGWRRLSDLPNLFTHTVASTKVKGISGPILAPNGYHVLFLIGRKSGISELTDKQIENILMQKKYESAIEDSLKKIRKQAYIKINPDYE